MPTRKQRRKRQKDRRHEYEFVYVDEEGQEVEVDPEEVEQAPLKRNGKRESQAAGAEGAQRPAGQAGRAAFLERVGKRALLFCPADLPRLLGR